MSHTIFIDEDKYIVRCSDGSNTVEYNIFFPEFHDLVDSKITTRECPNCGESVFKILFGHPDAETNYEGLSNRGETDITADF